MSGDNIATEKEIMLKAARRIGVLNEECTKGNEMHIEAYYDLVILFNDEGEIVRFETHP